MAKKELIRCESCGENKLPGSIRKQTDANRITRNFCIDCIEREDAAMIRNLSKPDVGLSVRARDPDAERAASLSAKVEKFSGNKYKRSYRGQVFDIYDTIELWAVTCPARQHAIKKLLCAGIRGKNDTLADLKECRDALTRAIELQLLREDN